MFLFIFIFIATYQLVDSLLPNYYTNVDVSVSSATGLDVLSPIQADFMAFLYFFMNYVLTQ